ncbi:MAG: hypothetical protein GX131_14115 [candidate division WS1 bacterium]|jgi:hypothetical protein|nr:hypothetical protein [candidate division WS1 bacterium]
MSDGKLKLGWAQADISPEEPVMVCGQFHARVSEGILDPITATALVLDSGDEHVVLISCDLVAISDEIWEGVQARLGADGPSPDAIVMNATHTHTAPEVRAKGGAAGTTAESVGVELPIMDVQDYVDFAADRISAAVNEAWAARAEGSVAFGLGQAVVGRNRRWVDIHGTSTMYGNTNTPDFSHIEGYEDHSVNILATYDAAGEMTGVVVNIACTAQETEGLFEISADFWHDTREELRRRLGERLFVLPQPSAAGDQSPHLIWGKREHERMLRLKGRTSREEIAHRIADAVEETLPFIRETREDAPLLQHETVELRLPLRKLNEEDALSADAEAANWRAEYEAELAKLEANPDLRDEPRWHEPRWYVQVTKAYRRMQWYQRVRERYDLQQKEDPYRDVTLHIVRLGDMAFATNPFEYYLDFGTYIKARTPATQTFLVQLAGSGSYVPSERSIAGGGYGSVPASTPIGPDGGRKVADATIDALLGLWGDE